MEDRTDEIQKDTPAEGGLVLPGFDSPARHEEQGSAENGLEVSDRQSTEIREIFGTTFPQYLQPAEEILRQILAGKGDAESFEALRGMLTSLKSASERMGFDDVQALLGRLHDLVEQFGQNLKASFTQEEREEVLGALEELKDVAEKMSGETAPAAEKPQRTIFSALKDREEVGELVLRRLSSAGVVLVDQIVQARPEEVAAVSGLDLKIVKRLQTLLTTEDTQGEARSTAADAPASPAGPAAEASPQLEALHQQVMAKLRGEADVEAEMEELAARIRALRSRVAALRIELDSIQDASEDKKKYLKKVLDQQNRTGNFLDEIKVERDVMRRKISDSEEMLSRKEALRQALLQEQRSLEAQKTNLCRAVDGLLGNLGRARRTANGEGRDD